MKIFIKRIIRRFDWYLLICLNPKMHKPKFDPRHRLRNLIISKIAWREGRIRLRFTREAKASRAVLVVRFQLLVTLRKTFLVVVIVLEVPHRRPPVLHQVRLVIRMEQPEVPRRHATQLVVVDAQVIHTPVRQLMTIVQLEEILACKNKRKIFSLTHLNRF